MNESELFQAALKLSSEQRPAFLEAACVGNPQLREAVELLLQAHFDSSGLLKDERVQSGEATKDSGAADPLSGVVIADRYKLLEQIGEGGMGTVWLAEQFAPIRRKVAVKLVKAGVNSKSVLARFDAERQALALMEHPNIARIYDGGITPQGQPYFVMEYVKGTSLTEYCDSARLPLHDRLQLFLVVCQAVQHAHQKGIIHRDLKPSNILACPYDGRPIPKIIDFGLAKALHQPLTELTVFTAHGTMIGTPMYMSPEQAEQNNLDVDTRSDIYSLGVILYELLTGTTPLEKHQLQTVALREVLRWIKEVEPPKPSTRLTSSASLPNIAVNRSIEPGQLRRSVSGDLDWIVMKSLEKERERRYGSVTGLARDIERFLNNDVVEACPPSAMYRLTKFSRKHRFGLLITGIVAALLVIGTVITGWQYLRARHAATLAIAAQQAAEDSRQDALSSHQSALEHLKSSRSVLQFLEQDLLAQAVSENSQSSGFQPDPNIRLRTAIDRAAERIGERFAGQPQPEMLVRLAIGNAYMGLGIYPAALDHLQHAWSLAEHDADVDHDVDHDVYLRSALSFATVQLNLGRFNEAQATLVQALNKAKDWNGDDSKIESSRLEGLLNMVRRLALGQKPGAEKSSDSTAKEAFSGEMLDKIIVSMPDAKTQAILRNSFSGIAKAMDLEHAGKTQEADAQMEKAVQSLNVNEQQGLKDVVRGMTAASAGKLDEALKLLENGHSQLEKQLGKDHPSVGMAAMALGAVEVQLTKFADAEPSLREALRIRLLTQSPQIELQNCQTLLGRALTAQGKYDEAESLLLAAVGVDQPPPAESMPALDSPDAMDLVLDPLDSIVDLYRAKNQSDLADRWQAARKK